jgi:hypothetical protein
MRNLTANKVWLRGYVGQYIKLPAHKGDPARFDMCTVDRLETPEGPVSKKSWHTIRTMDYDFVADLRPGDLVEFWGRMETELVTSIKKVEVVATTPLVTILTSEQRRLLKEDYDSGE